MRWRGWDKGPRHRSALWALAYHGVSLTQALRAIGGKAGMFVGWWVALMTDGLQFYAIRAIGGKAGMLVGLWVALMTGGLRCYDLRAIGGKAGMFGGLVGGFDDRLTSML